MSETRIVVRSSGGEYAVYVGAGLIDQLGDVLRAVGLLGKVALVTDAHVGIRWGERAEASLRQAGLSATRFTAPPGEGAKTLAEADRLYTSLIQNGFSRADTVVALGGGVVGDLAGFVAATYHRGVALVQVPTTLLAQVDASVGGKVAVDHALGKNLIGAFHPPKVVLADINTLGTLPVRERWCGMAEIVKAAFIADVDLLTRIERDLEALAEGKISGEVLASTVARAIAIKAKIVIEDEKEQGARMWLNFGHTFGHALEAACGYATLTHGEAVVCGMEAALELSVRLGLLAEAEASRARAVLARFPPHPAPPPLTAEAIRAALGRDKKVLSGELRFVALERLGQARIVRGLSPELIDAGVALTLEAASRRARRA